jgi:hypothetical protein
MVRLGRIGWAIVTTSWLGLLATLGPLGCGDGVSEGSTRSTGYVWIGQYATDPSSPGFLVMANFRRDSAGITCTTAAEADCNFYQCPALDAASDTPVPDLEAGTVTVVAEQTVSLVRQSGGAYPLVWSPGTLFSPGQAITVDIPGNQGDPPPFAATLAGPGPVTLTSPTGSGILVDRAQGITFNWTAASGQYVVVAVGSSPNAGNVSCQWPMADGQGLLPASLLQALPPGITSVDVQTTSFVDRDIGKWRLFVSALADSAVFDVTLQ